MLMQPQGLVSQSSCVSGA
ncbi:hypothetical protein IEO21_05646 [Rhodonia placenta]|uniref:Uncharacterized protein n=1 Tax=Rhodonia placenta TaxID=104341 RepID=A0A8H7P1Q8_9APHY|nr:hypothetical protein IEO21_05646 [Postia placenta]